MLVTNCHLFLFNWCAERLDTFNNASLCPVKATPYDGYLPNGSPWWEGEGQQHGWPYHPAVPHGLGRLHVSPTHRHVGTAHSQTWCVTLGTDTRSGHGAQLVVFTLRMVAKLCEIIADGVEAATCVRARTGARETPLWWGCGGGDSAIPFCFYRKPSIKGHLNATCPIICF